MVVGRPGSPPWGTCEQVPRRERCLPPPWVNRHTSARVSGRVGRRALSTLIAGTRSAPKAAWGHLREDGTGMWIGWIEFDVLLGDVHSLKEKRSVLRPLMAEIRKHFDVSVAEVDLQDLHRRAVVGVGLVAADRSWIVSALDAVENHVAARPGIDLLSARRGIVTSDD